ncbi:hypothetical protein Sjap_023840 [Stephania japonica]|uniref:Carboxypeptidase n=1 Tax=Stephania japonica TaxID=461633 RepID=A0AAP0EHM4_9MAGN
MTSSLFFLILKGAFLFYFFSASSAELITALPGQPSNISFKQYSGYIVTDAQQGRALFYYFVEAATDPLSRPLTLWFNGGPGCSSLGFGAFMEHGPFRPTDDGLLMKNKHSWNLESNMLYVESPIGVGFSYSNTSSNYILWNDTLTAEDNLKFIVNWLDEFPIYKDSDLYLTGESYAGHYVPQLAALFLEYNKMPNIRPIKLKAIAIGNPLLDLDISVNNEDYLWSHGAISDEALKLQKTVCNQSRILRESLSGNVSKECIYVSDRVDEEIGDDVDYSDILLPMCLSSGTTQQFKVKEEQTSNMQVKLFRRGSIGDACLPDRILSYLNSPEVQKSLHTYIANLSAFHWNFCDGPLKYQRQSLAINLIPLLSQIIKSGGIPIFLFSGDQDFKIPLTQTRIIANMLAKDLKLVPLTNYGTWYDNKQGLFTRFYQ